MSSGDESLRDGLRRLTAAKAGDCPAPERWLELARERLGPEEAEALRNHLEACPACAEVARDAATFAAALSGPRSAEHAWPTRRRLALAAAAAVAFAAIALWLVGGSGTRGGQDLARWSAGPLEPPRLAAPSIDEELLFRGEAAPGAADRQRLLAGFELLAAGRAAEARAPLRQATAAADAGIAAEARWYLALAELRAGDRAAAARALEPLRAGAGGRAADAEALARALAEGR